VTVSLLDLVGITRSYGNERLALDSIDLTVWPGDNLAIVGRSGSGKSTLLNIIGLLDVPDSGQYSIMGTDVSACSEEERCALRAHHFGFVFQSFHLINHRTVAENIDLGALYVGWSRRRRQALVTDLIERLGLTHRSTALPSTLSGGERQRVAIARALMGEPKLLLCDEPTGNLDTENADNVISLLHQLNADGITIVIVTHDRDVASSVQRTVTLRDGQVVDYLNRMPT
jgi:putative ABC transport system ATP-binding protein